MTEAGGGRKGTNSQMGGMGKQINIFIHKIILRMKKETIILLFIFIFIFHT